MKKIGCLILTLLLFCQTAAFAQGTVSMEVLSCRQQSDGTYAVRVKVTTDPSLMVTLLVMGEKSNGISPQTAFQYGGAAKNGYVYYIDEGVSDSATGEITFSFKTAIPGEMNTISDYLYVFSGAAPLAAKGETSFPVDHTLALEVGGNGKLVKDALEYLPGTASVGVADGKTAAFQIVPNDGYVVDQILYNGAPAVATGDGSYTTPAITADATLKITFKADETVPQTSSYTKTFTSDTGSVSFAKLVQPAGDVYTLKEYGVVYSKTVNPPERNKASCIALQGKKINAKGQFGIEIKGSIAVLGELYYTRPYAVYTVSGGGEKTVYGDVIVTNWNGMSS